MKLTPIKELPSLNDLRYPESREWMFDYCTYLGSFYMKDEKKVLDFGIFVETDYMDKTKPRIIEATVYGNDAGSYYSGDVDLFTNYTQRQLKLVELIEEYYGIKIGVKNEKYG